MSRPDSAYPKPFLVFAGLASWFANGHLPLWESVMMGFGATAFWLVVGLVLIPRPCGPMRPTGGYAAPPTPAPRDTP